MRTFLRDNGLTLVLLLVFAVTTVGMLASGQADHNADLRHGGAPVGLLTYASSGEFLSALFENWESEFLQMAAYVVLTAILFQRGSAESRDPDDPGREGDVLAWRKRPVAAWLYAHSLGLALAALFVASFVLHLAFSLEAANGDARLHGENPARLLTHVADPRFWFESFQNWQSEFLSTAVLVVLSIALRHHGSPESKPVAASNAKTGAT